MGLRIRALRKKKGLSVRALADLAGIGFSTVHRIETGRKKPRLETLEKLAKALKVKVGKLLE